ncbi:AMP-binding enzyme [Nostoc sp. CCY 9925]|uniref:AMP-binding enzyme n=1 Tax=Nostoc sp. CCY 9925 TaxID=3103865 RepID=UPI0039C68B7F
MGEIEAALAQHPDVLQTVVTTQKDKIGNQQLVAYIVAQPDKAPSTTAMRGFLLELLPDYMVPSAFVLLDTLPLTPNGKVDRRNLPASDPNQRNSEVVFVAANTSTEELLANIWADI